MSFVQRQLRTISYAILLMTILLSITTRSSSAASFSATRQHTTANFPTVDPSYIYDQLFFMATHFQHRESGYDVNLPPTENGHDEFAHYWAQEAARDLQGFGAQIRNDPFSSPGWTNRPPVTPSFNVEVSVPGAVHPEQVVIIGCHYDGEAISTQSANDDASGCAIELGVARALGQYWRSQHVYPARTIRFVIFDAEEQGLLGSFHYVNSTVNGDLSNIVAMFNEEQNGIAYPLRYLGRLANPLLPFYIYMSPLKNNSLYPSQGKLSLTQQKNILTFRSLMQQAVPAVFQEFQALGFQALTYHGTNKQEVAQPLFTAAQLSNVKQLDDTLGASDQMPFTLAGIPSATFVGNSTYYDTQPPAWSYPFDQKQDTIQLMNTFAQGGSQKSNALMLALALPGMLTTWMLNQPAILGETATSNLPPGTPVATISDIGQTLVGQELTLNANTSFVANITHNALTYVWNFGDGTRASGKEVRHTYTRAGTYTITLSSSSASSTNEVKKTVLVTLQTISYHNIYAGYVGNGIPPSNPQVQLPEPDDTLHDKLISSLLSTTIPIPSKQVVKRTSAAGKTNIPLALIMGISVLLVLLVGIIFVTVRRVQLRL
jgi:PKD repeat protein